MKVLNPNNDLGLVVPEIAIFDVDRVPETHEEWSANLEQMDLKEVLGDLALSAGDLVHHSKISYSMTRNPDLGKKRDWWAGDHLWHADGTRYPSQPIFSALACLYAEEGSPTTDVLDTARLLDVTLTDGFWGKHGIDEKDLPHMSSVFLDSTYNREAQPYLRNFMNAEERKILDAIIDNDKADAEVETFEEFLQKMDNEKPENVFPLVRQTPLSGIDSLFLDGGGRNSKILGPEGEDRTDVLHALRLEYLTGDTPIELNLVRSVGWTANRCIIFPQIGTLHRANPGNDQRRSLHIGALQEAT